jgi:hypothetical protein
MKIKSSFVVCFSLKFFRVTMEKIIARNVTKCRVEIQRKFREPLSEFLGITTIGFFAVYFLIFLEGIFFCDRVKGTFLLMFCKGVKKNSHKNHK